MTASFERIDYSIRTNKNIERKLVFERLAALGKEFNWRDYRYVGLGSMWFVDFILAHRALGMHDMLSLERSSPQRAEYNRPYSCIEVREGDTGEVIEAMTTDEWAKPTIVWFDYDGAFDVDRRSDFEHLLQNLSAGSVVLMSVNADRRSYRPGDQVGARVIERLRQLFGDAVPADAVPAGVPDVSAALFPDVLASALTNFMIDVVVTSGRQTEGLPDCVVPLFKLRHRDGVEMVTVGGVIASWRHLQKLESALGCSVEALRRGGAALNDVINMVPITIKEKLALDRLLPCDEAQFATGVTASGVQLPEQETVKYRRLYNYFPVFAETNHT